MCKIGGNIEKVSKEDFLKCVKDVYVEHNAISLPILKQYGYLDINYSTYVVKYGGMLKICKECGIPHKIGARIPPEDIIADYRRVYEQFGMINTDLYLKNGRYSKSAIKAAFGGIGELTRIIGVQTNIRMKTTKEDVIKDVRDFYQKYNSTSSNKYRKYGRYSQPLTDRLFGSWGNLLKEAGLIQQRKTYGKEYLVSEIKRVYDKYGFIGREIIDNECEFTYQALSYYFESQKEISNAIGVEDAFLHELSVGAQIIYDYLKDRYGGDSFEIERTWSWLKNDKTNSNLYVDFYIPSLHTAIEYDGAQHFNECEWFHRTRSDFEEQIYRDRLKDKLLKEHRIKVLRFSFKDKLTNELLAQSLSS